MAQSNAELAVKITANNAKLKRGLKDSERRVNSFAKSAKASLKKFATAGFVGVTAAVTGMIFQMNKASNVIDKLAKTSTKLGIGVAELQKLQFQAKLSGVTVETLNMALQRMVRRIAEAAMGTGEAVKALKELGIDAKALNQLSPDKQFQKISEAFAGIGQQSDKVRLAMKLFDSEGVALVNTLGLNLAKTGAEFDALGVSISASQAKAVEAFEDSQVKLSTVWSGFFMQLTAEAAPAFEGMIKHVLEVVKEMGGMKVVAQDVTKTLVSGFNTFLAVLHNVAHVLKTISSITGSVGNFAGMMGSTIGTGVSSLAGGSDFQQGLLKTPTRSEVLAQPRIPSASSGSMSRAASNSSMSKVAGATGGLIDGRIAIIVSSDNEAVIRKLETSQGLKDIIVTQVDNSTKNAARQVSR